MRYCLYIDESGDHGLVNLDPNFPVFLLCGMLVAEDAYVKMRDMVNVIKKEFWGNKAVIFHSRDIRKCQKEFQILFDLALKASFYEQINEVITDSDYTIFASGIRKDKYIKTYGRLSNDVYELSLSFIIERTVFYLDSLASEEKELKIIIEKRGPKEDKKLDEHFQRLLARGTGYVSAERLKALTMKIEFVDKKENINGSQMADLLAYPIARYVIDKARANPAFDQLEPKFYKKGSKRYGLKIFP